MFIGKTQIDTRDYIPRVRAKAAGRRWTQHQSDLVYEQGKCGVLATCAALALQRAQSHVCDAFSMDSSAQKLETEQLMVSLRYGVSTTIFLAVACHKEPVGGWIEEAQLWLGNDPEDMSALAFRFPTEVGA